MTYIKISNSFPLILICTLNLFAIAVPGQETGNATSFSNPMKIVKLLWKANPQSAASALARSMATAIERDQTATLKTALMGLQPEIAGVIEAHDQSDPRYAVALAASCFMADADEPSATRTQVVLASALRDIADIETRRLVWQAWLSTDLDGARTYLAKNITQTTDENRGVWQCNLISEALAFDRQATVKALFENWSHLEKPVRLSTIEPLTANADSMRALLIEVKSERVSKDLINTNQLRKWLASGHKELVPAIEAIWGRVRQADDAARQQLVNQVLQKIERGARGSAGRGSAVFDRVCSQCHVLHGRGFEVGPNIVGNGRGNLQQLVSNILDPSLVIGEAFQPKTVMTLDGQVVSGLLAGENERFLKLKLQGGKIVEFDREDIDQVQASSQSLMPAGVESQMTEQELLDLLAYLSLLKPLDAADNELIPGTPVDFVQP